MLQLLLLLLLGIYLAIGLIYAIYLLLFTTELWYKFPLNVIIGPIGLVLNIKSALKIRRKSI
ncbi:hypothetical protein H6802_02670 [Candidatus Nomurabacteria bacterium]|uniref:Uncharacterized protein n=1 Tax=candidate division WWE3 bacterium TaxID=2053526 RepID=A0A955IW58_UNCKA|nr:hypothetical protein [candidate division WWE3 bacterium]MCB9823838.1 hypothetical protein [Candidatus Nomurabacteria bacterium]